MTYIVLPQKYVSHEQWIVTDNMGRQYCTDALVDAMALANMLNMLTTDQRAAASVEAVAKWKERTNT